MTRLNTKELAAKLKADGAPFSMKQIRAWAKEKPPVPVETSDKGERRFDYVAVLEWLAGRKTKKRKPSKAKSRYTTAALTKLLAVMGDGKSLKKVCEEAQLSYRNVWNRVHEDDALIPLYARARENYAHAKVDEMHEITETEPDVQRARLKCDIIKWEVSKVLPKLYGDSLNLKHSTPDGPLVITAVDATEAAKQYQKIMGGS